MLNTIKKTILALCAVFAGAALLISCDTTSTDDLDDHQGALGFVIVQNNAEIVRFQNNQYLWNPDGSWDDYYRDGVNALVLSPDVLEFSEANPRGMTPSVTLRWIDGDGDVFDLPDDETGEFSLSWEWEKPNTLTDECSDEARENPEALDQIRPANLEQHGSDGLWGFHFRADHTGSDRVRFSLIHDDHPDFTSQWMDVVVADDEHALIDENGIYMHERNKCRVDRP
ncbi:hypothetical protein BH23BAC3_BH23BAC3_20490 [soil metagenome]